MALQKLLAKAAARESWARAWSNIGERRHFDRAAGAAASSQGISIALFDGVFWSVVEYVFEYVVLGVRFSPRRAPEEGRIVTEIAILPQIIAPKGAIVCSTRRIIAQKFCYDACSDP